MIRQFINVNNYWKVIVYYDINYNLFDYIVKDLKHIQTHNKTIHNIYKNMYKGYAKAVTINNIYLHTSVVAFNKHKNKYDYINSIVHEAEHIKQGMLKAYNIKDKGELPAYTVGYLVMKMMMIFDKI